MKFTAVAPVTFDKGAELYPTAEQLKRMTGLVAPIPDSAGWVVVTTPLQFKVGEEFEANVDEMPQSLAVPSEGKEAKADSSSMTVAELKAELTARGIEYPSDARKADLQALLDADG